MKQDNQLFAITGFISALVSIADFAYRFLTTSQIQFSWVSITAICVCVLSLVFYMIFKDSKRKYEVKKHVLFHLRRGDSYWVKKKECIYTYKSRTVMEHRKKHTIISCITNLRTFEDKFKWSKHQNVDDIKLKCTSNHCNVDKRREENWHYYTITFSNVAKKAEKKIDIIIKGLVDKDCESLPFLSSGIVNRTEELRLEVRFEDTSLVPVNIKYQIFDNYASPSPIYEEDMSSAEKLVYNVEENTIKVKEYKPICGYRYLIKWDFR